VRAAVKKHLNPNILSHYIFTSRLLMKKHETRLVLILAEGLAAATVEKKEMKKSVIDIFQL